MQTTPAIDSYGYEDVYAGDVFQRRVSGISDYDEFTVVNGNVNGDRVKPNPIYYKKVTFRCDPFQYVSHDVRFTASVFKGRMRADVTTGTTGLMDTMPSLPTSPINPTAYDKAYAKQMSKVRQGSSQILIDAAEWRQTRAMVTEANSLHQRVAGVFDHLHRYAKGYQNRDSRLLNAVSGRYLELRYGMMPLIGSVYDSLDNIHRAVLGPTLVSIKSRAGERISGDYSGTVLVYNGSQGKIFLPFTRFSEDDFRCEMAWDVVVPGTGIWDWTSLNPASIAWELLPMSFVADWFVSVGEALENLENWVLWRAGFTGGYVTYTSRSTRIGQVNASGSAGYQRTSRVAREVRVVTMKSRQVFTSLPLPNPPRIRINLNAKRVADAAALTHLLVGRKLRAIDRLATARF